jgi:hypothetical protein
MLRATLLAGFLAFGLTQAAHAATQHFAATLNGASEVPPHNVPGTGSLLATYDTTTKMLTYTLTYEGLTGPATAAHFHGPAKVGANAGVMVPMKDVTVQPIHGTATLTEPQAKALESGMMYVNVHTAANPGGEIRGQVMKSAN